MGKMVWFVAVIVMFLIAVVLFHLQYINVGVMTVLSIVGGLSIGAICHATIKKGEGRSSHPK